MTSRPARRQDRASADALNDAGLAHKAAGRRDEAARAFRAALDADRGHAPAIGNLGLVLWLQEKVGVAVRCLEESIRLGPDNADAHAALAEALLHLGRFADARAAARHASSLAPRALDLRSNALLCMAYDEAIGAQERFDAHRAFGAAAPAEARPHDRAHVRAGDPDRRLTLGYVSPDFNRHSVARFFAPLLRAHDRLRFRVACYQVGERDDATTATLRSSADAWTDARALDDAALAARMREDGVDVAIDLAGHTAGNRLGAFARRPAPVQASWLGYPDTTGLAAIDIRLTDAVADPPGSERWTTERLARLPRPLHAFDPDPDAPAVAPRSPGSVVFGSFNALPKLSDGTVALWSRVLLEVEGSRLLLKAFGLSDPTVQEAVRRRFAARGIASDRLDLRGRVAAQADHLGAYGEIDVALDPTHYNGTTTTCEALWMGVPVVSLRGDRHASRVGASLLTAAGMPQLVADGADAFVAIAAGLVRDPARRAALRAETREIVARSPLRDAVGLARAVESAYRTAWAVCCTAGAR
ncbi:MAG: tetratricopeptide repeat protein [Alphaproteobacteria bacterium]|nr:tetratricopeptide repeat protein [Alphaproteobacteria bacterium]